MLTPRQAAELMGVSVSLVYAWVESRQLAHYRAGTKGRRGKILITEVDLDAFLASLRCEKAGETVKQSARRPPIKLEHLTLPG
jgi:excisionase family DNA binding protein